MDEDPWDCPDLRHEVRLRQLKQLVGEFEAEVEDDNTEDSYLNLQPADVFLTGKAASSEISFKNLTEEDRQKFEVSMQKNGSHGRNLVLLKF